MAERFSGKVAIDIRDSEPDWTPYLAPKTLEGAPNVLMIAWDDLGFATMDTYGGPVQFAKVEVDVSGERCLDHEAQVRAWFAID